MKSYENLKELLFLTHEKDDLPTGTGPGAGQLQKHPLR